MKLANNIRLLVINIFSRNKRLAALTVIVLVLTIHVFQKFNTAQAEDVPQEPFNMIQARTTYSNPVYDKIGSKYIQKLTIEDKCSTYFKNLRDINTGGPGAEIIDLEFIQSFDFDKTIYQRETWFKQAKRKLRKELRAQHQRYNSGKEYILWDQFDKEVAALSEYENRVVQEFSHKRVFGKCYLSRDELLTKDEENICSEFEKKLYPWLSTKSFPTFENWKKEKLEVGQVPIFDSNKLSSDSEKDPLRCHMAHWKNISNGKGIVIPILPEISKSKQVSNILKLIKVIRVLKSNLPIQILYLGNTLSKSDKASMVYEARTERRGLPGSFNNYLQLVDNEHPYTPTMDYPKQDIWFVDIKSVYNKYQHPLVAKSHQYNSASFMLSLASIFNSFEEFVLLDHQVVPLEDDFANVLLNSQQYKEHGQYFFKLPYRQKPIRKRHRAGFDEVNDLMKKYLMPSKLDSQNFGLKRRSSDSDTNVVLNDKVPRVLDNSMIVINKSKHLLGLLLSCNLQIYKILDARFEVPLGSLFSDFLWMGMEVSGITTNLNFNRHYGAAAGVLTPLENRPYDVLTTSHELCSSSWVQISELDDHTLIYTTSHQLENWEEETFQKDIEDKFTTKLTANKGDVFSLFPEKQGQEVNEDGSQVPLSFTKEEIEKLEDYIILKNKEAEKEVNNSDDTEQEHREDNNNNDNVLQEVSNQPEMLEGVELDTKDVQIPPTEDTSDSSDSTGDKLEAHIPDVQELKNLRKRDDIQMDPIPDNKDVVPENDENNEVQINDHSSNDRNLPKLVISDEESQDSNKENQESNSPPEGEEKTDNIETVEVKNSQLFQDTFSKNPGYIQAVLRPPLTLQPVYDQEFKEPKFGWLLYEKFAEYRGHTYWCAYDIVGSPFSSTKGLITEYSQSIQARFIYILDIWKEVPEEDD